MFSGTQRSESVAFLAEAILFCQPRLVIPRENSRKRAVDRSIFLWRRDDLGGDASCGYRLPVAVVCVGALVCWGGDGGVGSRAGHQFIRWSVAYYALILDKWHMVSPGDTPQFTDRSAAVSLISQHVHWPQVSILFLNPSCSCQFFSSPLFYLASLWPPRSDSPKLDPTHATTPTPPFRILTLYYWIFTTISFPYTTTRYTIRYNRNVQIN